MSCNEVNEGSTSTGYEEKHFVLSPTPAPRWPRPTALTTREDLLTNANDPFVEAAPVELHRIQGGANHEMDIPEVALFIVIKKSKVLRLAVHTNIIELTANASIWSYFFL